MPVTNGYHLASLAQNKLDKEAHRSEHILRRLVGHANLLDSKYWMSLSCHDSHILRFNSASGRTGPFIE